MGEERFFVIDVESIGLHGEGFAVAYVVIGASGEIYEEGSFACDPDRATGTGEGRVWVQANVPPLAYNCGRPSIVRDLFWEKWAYWRQLGAVMVADCAWPVEARFLAACVDDDPSLWAEDGPYPLHELASFLVAVDRDPLMERPRRDGETPHDPLGDARQSARLLVECLQELQARVEHARD